MNKTLELLKLFEKFGVKPGKIIGAGDRKVVPIKKPILSKPLNRDYILGDVEEGKIGINTVKNEIEDIAPLFFQKQLNDVEINNIVNNLNYLDKLLNPTNVLDITTKAPVKGLESLRPTSIAGGLEKAGKQLEEVGKKLEETKPEINIGDLIKDFAQGQRAMQSEQRRGLTRATARSILYDDIKSGKIKGMTFEQLGSAKDPIDDFRKIYGENALEQLDSLADDFSQMTSADEAATFAKTRFKFEPRTGDLPETTTIEEAKKAEQEFGINKPAKVTDFKAEATKRTSIDDLIDEYNANQDRLRLSDEEGGTAISYDEFRKLQERNKQIADALENKGISSKIEEEVKPEGIVIPFRKKITEPEEFADGGITRTKFASGGKGKKVLDIIKKANKDLKGKKSMETVNPKTGEVTVPDEFVTTAEKQTKEFTDDEMIAYIKKYKEEGPTLEEFTKRINEQTGSNFTPEQLAHAYRVKVAYPHSTPIVDSQGKFIGGGLYNPPLDVSVSDREALTESIMQTRKAKGLKVPKKYQKETTEIVETSETLPKAGEGRFTKQQVLEKIIQKTIDANPTDEYVQTTFPNFIKEIRANPELANNENVWKTFTQDFPDNKRLVVYGDNTVDFFTKGENLPEGMRQTQELADTYGISMQEASRIKQMEPEDQVMEIKKLQVLKNRTQKYKPGDPITEENFGDTPFAPSQETLDNLKKAREMTKGMNLEEEMNMVLNQYDKSMFVKNEQGIVDVTNPENVQKMALLLKRDHPELYRRLEMEIGNQNNILEDFDITGRKPNASGGLNYLMGF
jgi:hypothetical protein